MFYDFLSIKWLINVCFAQSLLKGIVYQNINKDCRESINISISQDRTKARLSKLEAFEHISLSSELYTPVERR